MKRFLTKVMCIVFILCLAACDNIKNDKTGTMFSDPVNTVEQTKNEDKSNANILDDELVDKETYTASIEESEMKLFTNDVEIPVIWEENDSVAELMEEASKEDIIISMSMYGHFEQVGSLGKKYRSNDKQMTVHNGDIVLYNSSNIVLFYGSNTWAYTKLGKMNLSEQEVIDLLSNGNVKIKISR